MNQPKRTKYRRHRIEQEKCISTVSKGKLSTNHKVIVEHIWDKRVEMDASLKGMESAASVEVPLSEYVQSNTRQAHPRPMFILNRIHRDQLSKQLCVQPFVTSLSSQRLIDPPGLPQTPYSKQSNRQGSLNRRR